MASRKVGLTAAVSQRALKAWKAAAGSRAQGGSRPQRAACTRRPNGAGPPVPDPSADSGRRTTTATSAPGAIVPEGFRRMASGARRAAKASATAAVALKIP